MVRIGDHQVLPSIGIRYTFVDPEVNIDVSTFEHFCSVVGNRGDSFKEAHNAEVEAPMDFVIFTLAGMLIKWRFGPHVSH